MTNNVTVAAVQLSSGPDSAENVSGAISLVHEAADRGATYVQLPEYFNFLGPAKGFDAVAEPIPGPTTERMAAVALQRSVTLHVGSLLERSATSGNFYNTSVLFGPDGRIVATYRKIHLFDVNVHGAVVHRESDVILPGQRMVTARLHQFTLGMTICFDVRFPELYRSLCAAGAQVLAIPAAFNETTGRAHWETLVRARAIENHAFVVAAAQVGETSDGIATHGHTLIVDPWGTVIAESHSDGPDVVVATLDVDDVERRRREISVMDLRRPDVYGSGVKHFEQ